MQWVMVRESENLWQLISHQFLLHFTLSHAVTLSSPSWPFTPFHPSSLLLIPLHSVSSHPTLLHPTSSLFISFHCPSLTYLGTVQGIVEYCPENPFIGDRFWYNNQDISPMTHAPLEMVRSTNKIYLDGTDCQGWSPHDLCLQTPVERLKLQWAGGCRGYCSSTLSMSVLNLWDQNHKDNTWNHQFNGNL